MKKKAAYVIARVAKKIRIALFVERSRLWAPKTKEHGKKCAGWIAADLTSYHVAQGESMPDALHSLFETLHFTEVHVQDLRKKGHKVVRERLERRGADHIREMEKKARFILEDVDWREALKVRA